MPKTACIFFSDFGCVKQSWQQYNLLTTDCCFYDENSGVWSSR